MKTGKLIKPLLVLLIFALIVPALVYGQSGKIRGTVTDAQSGKPLIAANVVIEETMLGAATDKDGEYIILNVPGGTFTLKVSYMGYRDVRISNVKVVVGLTTEINFPMSPETIAGETITIVAERPLVNKNATNYVRTMWSEDLDNLPIRGAQAVVSEQAGVVRIGNDLHIRGGRSHENAWYVDGVYTTSVRYGSDALNIVDRAIEEITYQGGGMTAEYGFANSGVVSTTTKTGGRSLNISAEIVSDDFWALKNDEKGYRILGINKLYSYGYDDYFLTVGGPVPGLNNEVRFFAAAQHYWRGSNATWFEGWKQDPLWVTRTWALDSGTAWESSFTDSVNLYANIPPGRIPGGGDLGNTVNANVVWDHKPFRLKIGGSYHKRQYQQRSSGDPQELIYVPTRGYLQNDKNYSGYVRFTHTVDPTMFYTLNLNYLYNGREYGDRMWGDDVASYGDPTLNSAIYDTSMRKLYIHPMQTSFDAPNRVYNAYEKRDESYMGTKFDLTKQFGKRHELKMGGELNYYTLRRYYISPRDMLKAFELQEASVGKPTEISDYYTYRTFMRNYGYDIYGNKIDKSQTYWTMVGGEKTYFDGKDAPPHPIFAGAYFQDKIELKDLIINAGVRFDYYKTGTDRVKDLRNMQVAGTGFLAEESFEKGKAYTYLSPRLGFSFPVTDRTVFHAQFGKFVQLTRMTDIFESWGYFSYALFSAGYARQYSNPNLKPEREIQYEFGFAQQFGTNASLDITAFYKSTKDLVAIRTLIPVEGASYQAPWINTNMDFATSKGISATFRLRRTMRISGQVNYTLSYAEGTGSESGSHFNIAWAEDDPHFPQVIMPLEYDRRHKGSANIDVRLLPEDGPMLFGVHPLGNVGLDLMARFYSGSPYTAIEIGDAFSQVFGYNQGTPLEALNGANMPWFYQLDAKLDKTLSVGPLKLNVYLWALNLLNTKSATDVWRQTGRPDSDGHLETADGKARAAKYPYGEEEYKKWYQAILTNCGTWGWQAPRRLRFGLKVMF